MGGDGKRDGRRAGEEMRMAQGRAHLSTVVTVTGCWNLFALKLRQDTTEMSLPLDASSEEMIQRGSCS